MKHKLQIVAMGSPLLVQNDAAMTSVQERACEAAERASTPDEQRRASDAMRAAFPEIAASYHDGSPERRQAPMREDTSKPLALAPSPGEPHLPGVAEWLARKGSR